MKRRIDSALARSWLKVSVAAVFAVSIGNLACQSYTTGVKKTETHAGESSAIGAMRTVALAQQAHAVTNGGNHATFLQLVEGGYLDSRFNGETPELQGYVLRMNVGDKTFSCNADPVGDEKGRHFYIDSSSALIRVNETQAASAKDNVLKL